VILFVFQTRDGRRRHHSGARGDHAELFGQFGRELRLIVELLAPPVVTGEGARVLPALLRQDEVHHGTEEHEGRGERIDANAGDVGSFVGTQQLDPEPAHAVQRHIQREQPAVADSASLVDDDQDGENQ